MTYEEELSKLSHKEFLKRFDYYVRDHINGAVVRAMCLEAIKRIESMVK